jgi:hypothetical protein
MQSSNPEYSSGHRAAGLRTWKCGWTRIALLASNRVFFWPTRIPIYLRCKEGFKIQHYRSRKKDLRKVPHLSLAVLGRHDTFPVWFWKLDLTGGTTRLGPEMLIADVEYIDCTNRIKLDNRDPDRLIYFTFRPWSIAFSYGDSYLHRVLALRAMQSLQRQIPRCRSWFRSVQFSFISQRL